MLIRGNGNRAFYAGVEAKDHLVEMMTKMVKDFDRMFGLCFPE
ncbi:MAG: hypothetical protein OEW82_08490 [Dehalococcoidia bacterium]|nr:hypothetical protein [Dehalococcoidia bacterium]